MCGQRGRCTRTTQTGGGVERGAVSQPPPQRARVAAPSICVRPPVAAGPPNEHARSRPNVRRRWRGGARARAKLAQNSERAFPRVAVCTTTFQLVLTGSGDRLATAVPPTLQRRHQHYPPPRRRCRYPVVCESSAAIRLRAFPVLLLL